MTDKQIIIDGDKFEKAENEPINQEAVNKFIEDTDKFYPKNSKIMYDYNAKDCEQCNPDSVCCYCKNIACYKLEEQLKRKEQECKQRRETMRKDLCTHYVLGECSQNHHDNCVGRNQCIKDLEQEYEELKKQLESTKGLVTIGNKQLAKALEKNEELEKLYKANKNCFEKTEKLLDESEQERMKLKQTLAEIKKLVEKEFCTNIECCEFCANSNDCLNQKIINKINEVEDDKNM